MACAFYRSRRRSLPPSGRSWWMPTTVLFSLSAAAALAFQASPTHHHPTTTPAVSRLCKGEAYRATGSWSSEGVKMRPAGPGSQRRHRSDPAATTTTLASMAPGAGVMAQEEDDRTRCVRQDRCRLDVHKSQQSAAPGNLSAPWALISLFFSCLTRTKQTWWWLLVCRCS